MIFSQLLEMMSVWSNFDVCTIPSVYKHSGKFLDQTDENYFLWANTFFGTYIEDIGKKIWYVSDLGALRARSVLNAIISWDGCSLAKLYFLNYAKFYFSQK